MGTPYFQQQSAAYNIYQKNNLHIFTPDGQRYLVGGAAKSYAEYAGEVQDHLVQFEVESLLAQRDSLRDALARRYLVAHFGATGDANFSGIDLDATLAELKRRGLAPTPIKSALRTALSRANSEVKDIWPIRENGRNLQYTSYDLVFAATEMPTPAKRQKIWDVIAAWAAKSRLSGKEGARLATVQDWDDLGDAYAVRVDLHHYPRPDPESCAAITLLDAAERNKDLELLRKALAKSGAELEDLAVKPYALPQSAPQYLADRENAAPPPQAAPPAQPAVAELLAAVRAERERLEQPLRQLSAALSDSEERQRQARRIDTLEQEKTGLESVLLDIFTTLDRADWPDRPANWAHASLAEKTLRIVETFELRQAALNTAQVQLTTARDKLNAAAVKLHQSEDDLESTRQALEAAKLAQHKTGEAFDELTRRHAEAGAMQEKTQQELQSSRQSLAMTAQKLDQTLAELQKTREARDEWQGRAENIGNTVKAELLKQHNADLLAQELDFTRQIQDMQQGYMNQAQETHQEHMREIQELQASHLKQIQKLRRLAPPEPDDGWNMPQPGMHVPRGAAPAQPPAIGLEPLPSEPRPAPQSVASQLGLYQQESQEIFDSRIGEYLRIAKDLGLSEADKWLLAEARKLAEARAKQGELGI